MIQQMDVLPVQQKSWNSVFENTTQLNAKQDFKSIMQTLAQSMNKQSPKTNEQLSGQQKSVDVSATTNSSALADNVLITALENDSSGLFRQMPIVDDDVFDDKANPIMQESPNIPNELMAVASVLAEQLKQSNFLAANNQAVLAADMPKEAELKSSEISGLGNVFIAGAPNENVYFAVAGTNNSAAMLNSSVVDKAFQAQSQPELQPVTDFSAEATVLQKPIYKNTLFVSSLNEQLGNSEALAAMPVGPNISETALPQDALSKGFEQIGLTNDLKVPIKQVKAEGGWLDDASAKTGAQNTALELEKPVRAVSVATSESFESTKEFAYAEQQKTDTDTLTDSLHTVSFIDQASAVTDVSQTAEMPAEVAKPIATQLVEEVQKGLLDGKKEFQIELHPVNLGKVSVKMVSEGGMLTVEIKALNPDTQTMLLTNADEIKAILHAAVNHNVRFAEAAVTEQYSEQHYEGSGTEREKEEQEQREEKHPAGWVEDGNAEITADDFLALMQEIEAAQSYLQ